MIRAICAATLAVLLSACATTVPAPSWSSATEESEREYLPYLTTGSASLTGQAFLVQRNGTVVTAAGRTVTLTPATRTGQEWWTKAGVHWMQRGQIPPSPNFAATRRTAVADATGRFRFSDLPAGTYYVQTEITWEVGNYMPTQGGLVGGSVELVTGKPTDVILNTFSSP